MPVHLTTPASSKWVRLVAFLGPVGVPVLIAFECSLQSMILFEGLFLAAFLLAAALSLRPFLARQLHWPFDRLDAWSNASVWGTVVAALLTLLFALEIDATSAQAAAAQGEASTAEYLTVAIGFPLVLGIFQARAARAQLKRPELWPLVPALGSALSYAASQVIELLETIEPTGLATLVLTLVAAFLMTYWIQRLALVRMDRKIPADPTSDVKGPP